MVSSWLLVVFAVAASLALIVIVTAENWRRIAPLVDRYFWLICLVNAFMFGKRAMGQMLEGDFLAAAGLTFITALMMAAAHSSYRKRNDSAQS